MDVRNQLLIDGEWVSGHDRFATVNPATEEVITEVEEAGSEQVDAAVRSARSAVEDPAWRDMDPHRRSRLLWRLADLIEQNSTFIAETIPNMFPWSSSCIWYFSPPSAFMIFGVLGLSTVTTSL